MEDEFVKILEKTRELSNSFSIRRLSLDEICRKIGVSKSTLHKYVKNKTELVEEALKFERQQFEDIFLTNDFEHTNAIDILFTVSLEVCRRFNQVSPSVTFDLAKYYPDVYRKHIDNRTEYIFEKIQINIEKGIRQGMYRPDFSIELVARLYISRLIDIHNPEFFPPEKYSFGMLFEVMFENFVRSIATIEGMKYFETCKANIKFEL
jgi:AcrR family transcriptional regulator